MNELWTGGLLVVIGVFVGVAADLARQYGIARLNKYRSKKAPVMAQISQQSPVNIKKASGN